MNTQEELIRRLKFELAKNKSKLEETTRRLNQLEQERKGLFVSAGLKFGTMVGSAMELILPVQNPELYEATMTDHPGQKVVRIKRR